MLAVISEIDDALKDASGMSEDKGRKAAETARSERAAPADVDLMDFIEAVPPGKLDLVVATVARTSEGRTAVLKAASKITGVDLVAFEPDFGGATRDAVPVIDDIDTSDLMRAAGEMLTSSEVAERLGPTRQNVNELLKGERIIGVRSGGSWRFPSAQFRHHELLPGLSSVLKAMVDLDPWRRLEVLLAPSEPIERRPIELLRKGDRAKALAVASRKAAAFRDTVGATSFSGTSASMDADLEADLRRDQELDAIGPFAAAF